MMCLCYNIKILDMFVRKRKSLVLEEKGEIGKVNIFVK